MARTWLGRKKIAFVPVYRSNAHPPDQIPADWNGDILRRVLFDPDPTTGADRSLRTYIHTASSGLADLDPTVLPMVTVDAQDVPVDALESQMGANLRSRGFDAAALVMLGGVGAGTAQKGGFWARFVMVEGVGVWAMELMHCLTGFADLYWVPPYTDSPQNDIGRFDQMSAATATHPSSSTKAAIQWLDTTAIVKHASRASIYSLHSVGLPQPPPAGRFTAIQIGSSVPYLMVEARQKVDPFEAGIPSEGVIVYRVQTSDPLGGSQNKLLPLFLLTKTALGPGQSFVSDTNVSVSVLRNNAGGGFSVAIDNRNLPVQSGELLFYRDTTRNGTGDVNTPAVIGLGGWQQLLQVFYGGDGIIYAVNQQGQLLFYRDNTRNGTGDVNTPAVIGQGGWQQMRHLFSGDKGVIYAVNQQGQLLFYRDNNRNGTGDVNTPGIIGQGGWQSMRHLFYGGDGIIYAVNQAGQLLFYRDTTRNGTGDVNTPSVIGQGGWQQMSHLFYGGDGIIYAVNQAGQLLFYRDRTRNGTGDVNTPSIIGQGGWQQMKYLFSGDLGVIYAVPA